MMNRPFAIYPDSFDGDTLGYWRFGETAGRLTDVVNGVGMVNNGANIGQDGYRFNHLEADWMEAALPDQEEEGQVTVEAWCRDWGLLNGAYAMLLSYAIDADTKLILSAMRNVGTPALSGFYPRLYVGGVVHSQFNWTGVDVNDILVGEQPFHIALVLNDDAGWLRFFVDGVLRGQDTSIVPLPTGNYRLSLGIREDHVWNWANIVEDEVRLSKVARYDADFPITRFGEGRRALIRGPGDGAWLGGMVA